MPRNKISVKSNKLFTNAPVRSPRQSQSGLLLINGIASPDSLVAELGQMRGIAEIREIDTDYPLVSRKYQSDATVVTTGEVSFGAGMFTVIAGPCVVEGKAMIEETARFLSSLGVKVLRGGSYKARTSPYSFLGYRRTSVA